MAASTAVASSASSEHEEGKGEGLAEYRCVRRLRHKRLLSFLLRQGHPSAFTELLEDMDEHDFFNLGHMKRLVLDGQWEGALGYLGRYLPPHPNPMSFQAHVLLCFVRTHNAFAAIVAGKTNPDVQYLENKYRHYLNTNLNVSHSRMRVRSIILSILYSESIRASLDWVTVRYTAMDSIRWWAGNTPELQRHHPFAAALTMPHNVLPIGFGLRQKRPVKKQGPRPRTLAVARVFCETKRKFFPSDPDERTVGLTPKAVDHLANILDRSLTTAKRMDFYPMPGKYSIGQPLQPSVKEDAPGGLVSETMLGTLTDQAKNSGISSVTNAEKSSQAGLELHQGDQLQSSGKEGATMHRMEELTIVEEDHDPKRLRTSGAFGEASLQQAVAIGDQ